MKENKENQNIDQFLEDEELVEKSDIYAIIEEMFAKKENMSLLKTYILNYVQFINNIDKMTVNPNNFMSLTQLEEQITLLIEKSKMFANQLTIDKLSKIDEGGIIQKKKEEYLSKGVKLRIYRRLPRTVMTIHGKIPFSRTALIGSSPSDCDRLSDLGLGINVFPFDELTGISILPFKMSVQAMLETAFWVQKSSSYVAAARILARGTGIGIDPDTVRMVANHIGEIVFNNDMKEAEKVTSLLNSGKLEFPTEKKKGILYIETDGALLHTRQKDEQGSGWKENKLGMVFSSDFFKRWINKKGELQHSIGKREYITYVGEAEIFKMHLFALALRNGYGQYKETVLISDGATWIRNMKEELFPDAQQILDFFHLCENISTFGKAVFDMDEQKYKPWLDEIIDLFKNSQTNEAIKKINSLGKKNLAKSKFNLLGYINNNINNIDYAEYKKRGYFIGSGAIESANRTVLQERLKRPGMRWNKQTGQYILTLMSKAKSDISRGCIATNGIWKRDVEQAISSKYEVRGFVDFAHNVLPFAHMVET
ncbi:MAG: hypothetical protein LBF22_03770 [Deltaproteobacteria bacterium]|jgi:hypothetical protein|nr:hypothetical protein [Deltaproteobacteria bacterium]